MPRRVEAEVYVAAARKFFAVKFLAAIKHVAAFALHPRDRALHILKRRLVDERTHQRLTLEGITDLHRFVSSQESIPNFVRDRLVNNDPPRRSATLSGRSDGAE